MGTALEKTTSKPRIPSILHQIWHAVHHPNPPQRYLEGTRSFQEKHPDWIYKFWDDKSSRSFISTYYRWFLPTYIGYNHWIKRVDALRFFLLHYYGGVYLDMDAECWKKIESLLGNFGFVACSNYHQPGEVGNGFLAAVPGHPLLEQIISKLPHTARRYAFESTGPAFLGEQVAHFDNASRDVKIYPPHFVYPQDATGTWRVHRNHPEIFIWNYMDGLWLKPLPGPRIIRIYKRGKNRILSMLLRIFIKSRK